MEIKRKNTRLVLFGGVILSLLLIANAAISIYLLRQNTINERKGQLANLTLVLAEHASQTMFSANTMLDSMAEVIDQANILTISQFNDFASQKAQFEILTEKTNSNPIMDVATFVALDGRVLNFSREFPAPQINLSDRDYFKWLSTHDDDRTFYSLPVQNRGNGKWVFYLARRIVNVRNELLGFILVGVSVEVFTDLYKRVGENLGVGAGLSLYRDDRTLLIRWPTVDDMIGKINHNVPLLPILGRKEKNQKIYFTDEPSFSQNIASTARMISIQKLERYPLFVLAGMTRDLYVSGSYESSIGILYATAVSLLFVIISMVLLIKAYLHNQKIQHLAEHDKLTSLPNRLLLEDRMKQALALTKRNNKKFAVIYVDIDHFKTINDTLGHDAGDVLLKETARRMISCIRETDTVSRIGGDEFLILLYDIESKESALFIAENILNKINQEVSFSGQVLKTSASIGIAIYPEDGETIDILEKNADIAMYMAKKSGRNKVRLYAGV